MKTNSDEAIAVITLLTETPHGLPSEAVKALHLLARVVKKMDAENFKLNQEVQMLRAVLEQERDKVC